MIDPAFVRMMARYNLWQNRNVCQAADVLPDAERRKDKGAFFKSIHGTLSHVLWADGMWLSRISDASPPSAKLAESASAYPDWAMLIKERAACDARLVEWADGLEAAWLEGDLKWWSGATQKEVVRPKTLVAVHIFNHQTHHRGQVHAMLTSSGVKLSDTDLLLMPNE
jgi:uncharacterized damage-inducible protein DinB